MECNDKEELKSKIMSLNFAINDIVLYLDTHPNDVEKIKLHNEYVEEVEYLVKKYQMLYEPLTVNYQNEDKNWKWKESPWPWERGI